MDNNYYNNNNNNNSSNQSSDSFYSYNHQQNNGNQSGGDSDNNSANAGSGETFTQYMTNSVSQKTAVVNIGVIDKSRFPEISALRQLLADFLDIAFGLGAAEFFKDAREILKLGLALGKLHGENLFGGFGLLIVFVEFGRVLLR